MGLVLTDVENKAKILCAADAIYATLIEDQEVADIRGDLLQKLDDFYSMATGAPEGTLVREMEKIPAGKRWQRWSSGDEFS